MLVLEQEDSVVGHHGREAWAESGSGKGEISIQMRHLSAGSRLGIDGEHNSHRPRAPAT